MSTISIDILKKSLALSIACGRSVRSWAKRHDVDIERAREWCAPLEFRDLVEVARLRVADRMVGRLLRAADVAVDELIRLCTKSASDAVRLSAGRAVLDYWITVSKHFNIAGRLFKVEENLDSAEARDREWCPPSPHGYAEGRPVY